MEIWHGFLKLLDTPMTTPLAYGPFHLVSIALSLLAAVLLCICYNKGYIKNVHRVVFVVSLIVIALEVVKQVNYSFDANNNFAFDYQWYAFPWQFCSTPMCAGFLVGLTKPGGRVHDALCAYLATYALFGGAAVMALPGDVFIDTVCINIQTMVCHGSMVTIGIFLFYTNYVKAEWKTILRALPVFAAAVGIAVVLNELAYRVDILETETFNMFFVSPYCEPHLIVYSSVQAVVPFPWCLFIYILGFTVAALLVLLLAMGIVALCKCIARKTRKTA